MLARSTCPATRSTRFPLLAAGVCFAIAGLLGILSIGILFVALSAVCFVFAERAHRRSVSPPSSA